MIVVSPTDFVQTEIELNSLRADIDALFISLTEDYERGTVLGLDLRAEQATHQAALVERTELLGAALEQALEQQADYQDWITKPGVDTVAMGLRIAAAEEEVLGTTASLQAMVDLMAGAGLEVSNYRRLIVTATGDIGIAEVLDVEVVSGLIAQWSETAFAWFDANIATIVLRLVIIVLVLLLASQLSRLVRKIAGILLLSKRVDLSSVVRNLTVSALANLVWVIAFFGVLSLVGIDLGPALAGLGIAGFVIGFALQDTLGNFASGLMIMMHRPFDVGDWIITAGVSGEVKDLTLVSTVIRTVDNRRVTIPNGKVWGDVINNANAEETRRVDVVFNISHSGDVDLGLSILQDILANEERVLEDPEPAVKVKKLEEFSVQLLCAPWCKTEDYWGLYWDLNRVIKKRFDAEGVSFPFPQMDEHVRHEGAGSSQGPSTASGAD